MLYSILFLGHTLQNIATLHSCALVCRDWRVRSQRMLFYQVQLSNTTSFHRLSTILDDGRHLHDYVYEVQLTGYHLHHTTSIFALFPAVFAGKMPNLCCIKVVHFSDTVETRFPRISDSPKARALAYIPLHPRFPAFLSTFTAVSLLHLAGATFSTFSEIARMLHGFPNLEGLVCHSIRWIAPGGSHPGADFTKEPEWATGKDTLPHFAPKLENLGLYNVAMYGAKRLIWTRGPHLIFLSLTIPLSSDPEELKDGGGINLGSCTGLETLYLHITSQFLMDAHAGFVAELLASWRPRHLDPVLRFIPYREDETTRQGFAEVLRGLGTITEAWLKRLEEPPPSGEIRDHQDVKYWLKVDMCDWEAERRWWLDHLESCFPTWVKLRRLKLTLRPPRTAYDKWANEEKPTLAGMGAAATPQADEVEPSSPCKVTEPAA